MISAGAGSAASAHLAYQPSARFQCLTTFVRTEWVREEEEKSGKGGATSTKNLLGMGEKFLKK